MVSLALAAIGAAIGVAALGAAAVVTGAPHGLDVALTHIPSTTHGYDVVTAVLNAIAARGTTGASHGIGAAVSAVASAR